MTFNRRRKSIQSSPATFLLCAPVLVFSAAASAQDAPEDLVTAAEEAAISSVSERLGVNVFMLSSPVTRTIAGELPTVESGFSAYRGICPDLGPLQHFTGGGAVAVPGFVAGEEVAVILDAPAGDYPIEIISIGIGWGSIPPNGLQSLEDSLRIYPAGLPNPGAAQFTVGGPVLTEGVINVFDITAEPGNRVLNSGPFTVSMRLLNPSPPTGPAPVHDGNGCQFGGNNAIFAIPGGWLDACLVGVTGDWIMFVNYRQVNCNAFPDCNNNGVDDADDITSGTSLDCNTNSIPDECDIASGFSLDVDPMDGIPDECQADPCPWDFNNDGLVGSADLAILLGAWGPCPPPPGTCDPDFNFDGFVISGDLAVLLGAWGPCPS